MVGDKSLNTPLTAEEKALVEEYHNIIYRVMSDCKCLKYKDEIYGDAALMLIRTARHYLKGGKIQKYKFSTIAYRNIRKVCVEYHSRIRYDISLDDEEMNYHEIIALSDYTPINDEIVLKRYAATVGLLTEKELFCAELCASGLTSRQAEKYHGINHRTFDSALKRGRDRCMKHYHEIFNEGD